MARIERELREKTGYPPSIAKTEAERNRLIYAAWLRKTKDGVKRGEKMEVIAQIAMEFGMDHPNSVNMIYKIIRDEGNRVRRERSK